MEDIHTTFLATSILEINSVNFGNKKGIRSELFSKINAVGSNLSFKSFPKLESYLYIASRVLFLKILTLVSFLKKVFKNVRGKNLSRCPVY